MTHSESIAELAAALAKAQGAFGSVARTCTAKVRTKSGSEYSYDYADLEDVLRAVRPALAENGLTLNHDCRTVEGAVETTAILLHGSGQWLRSSPLRLPLDGHMAAAQLVGSACTYGRRYTTQAMLGIATEDDDDGNAAGGNDAHASRKHDPRNSSLANGGPSQHRNAPKPEAKPTNCPEYEVLAARLRLVGCVHEDKEKAKDMANAVINWLAPGIGDIAALRQKPSECSQVAKLIDTCGKTDEQILDAALGAAVTA